MRTRKSWMSVVGFSVVLAIACTSAEAKRPKGGNGNGGNTNGTQTQPPAAEAPPASQPTVPSQFSQDQAAQAAAAADLKVAQEKLKTILDAEFTKYQQTPDWVAA